MKKAIKHKTQNIFASTVFALIGSSFYAQTSSNTSNNKEILVTEAETDEQRINNTSETAQFIPNLNTTTNLVSWARITGAFNNFEVEEIPVIDLGTLSEADDQDNGTISTATVIDFENTSQTVKGNGFIGDGANSFGRSGFGDHDYYEIFLKKGQTINVQIESIDPDQLINPVLFVIPPTETFFLGRPVTSFDTLEPKSQEDSSNSVSLDFTASDDGIHYVTLGSYLIGALPALFQPLTESLNSFLTKTDNPELRFPSMNEGPYSFTITFDNNEIQLGDNDFYAVNLKKGDVISMGVEGPIETVKLFDPNNKFLIGFNSFGTSPFAEDAPLVQKRIDDNEGLYRYLSYVVPTSGRHTFAFSTTQKGDYIAEVNVSRPGQEINKGQKQIVYLDFTGGEFTHADYIEGFKDFTEEELKARTLSPLSEYMENWGFENTKLDRIQLAFKITEVIKENFRDVIDSNINPNADILFVSDYSSTFLGKKIPKILDRFNIPYSTMMIGGSYDETGYGRTGSGIGRATIVDVGNYSLDDFAYVLLGRLSADESDNNSINSIPLAKGADKKDLVATVVGNIASHEIGHYLGNDHTLDDNEARSIMDATDSISRSGVLPGDAFGDGNTLDIDFVADVHSSADPLGFIEGSIGDPVNNIAWGLNTVSKYGYKKLNNNSELSVDEQLVDLEDVALKELDYAINTPSVYNFPNPMPVNGATTIYVTAKKTAEINVNLWSVTGGNLGTLYQGQIINNETKEIQLEGKSFKLTTGVYIYTVEINGHTYTNKLLVE